MTSPVRTGRTNQKERTRTAILEAALDLIRTGREVTMPTVAQAALVSEATAYRYFPDLVSLLREAMAGLWPSPAEILEPLADVSDPVDRVAYAAESLFREVLALQGAVRAMMASTITRPGMADGRPGRRFGLIDHALAPLAGTLATTHPQIVSQLKRDLAIVMSAEALFTLTDLCGLSPDEAVASAVETARTLTSAALRPRPPGADTTSVLADRAG